MLEQISRISQQIGYYLHRASMRSGGTLLSRELHPIAPLLDSLTSALNKVYQRKGVNISLDISPEITFVGEQNDFMEVMGNVLDNACKYCLGVRGSFRAPDHRQPSAHPGGRRWAGDPAEPAPGRFRPRPAG